MLKVHFGENLFFVATRISHYIKECRKFSFLNFSITLYILGPYNAYCPVIAPFNFFCMTNLRHFPFFILILTLFYAKNFCRTTSRNSFIYSKQYHVLTVCNKTFFCFANSDYTTISLGSGRSFSFFINSSTSSRVGCFPLSFER